MTAAGPRPALYIRKARGMGRGVFAGRKYRKGEVIEVCPVIALPEAPGGMLERYVFRWGEDGVAVALGYGSLYNHSAEPNAKFAVRESRAEVVFRALRDIAVGEQILIDYGWEEDDYTNLLRPPE